MRVVEHEDIKGWLEITLYGKQGYIPRRTKLETASNLNNYSIKNGLLHDLADFLNYHKFMILGGMLILMSIIGFVLFRHQYYLSLPFLIAGLSIILKECFSQ